MWALSREASRADGSHRNSSSLPSKHADYDLDSAISRARPASAELTQAVTAFTYRTVAYRKDECAMVR